ncbi:pentatricopeptide repeat-containing protein At1g62350-like [Hibiscus syriacus]|nr:pentatricopeptide repeat-containing protein At1g62350-like [Hibiscus syriacus]
MGTLPVPQMGFIKYPQQKQKKLEQPSTVTCGLRGGKRKPLWKSRVLSTEAIQTVHSLKLANSDSKLHHVFSTRLSRLLKADLLDTLAELQRQNEFPLSLKVFEFVRKEVWYKPDMSMYCDMIQLLGKNKMIEMAEQLFDEVKEDGLKPNTRAYTELIGAYLQVGMIEKAMETYDRLKASGCSPDKLTFTILLRNLKNVGKKELAAVLKKDCIEYMEYPERFLEDVKKKHSKRQQLDLV